MSNDEKSKKKMFPSYSKGPCTRCSIVDLDPKTGLKKGQKLRALSEYRRQHGQISFGIFLGTENNKTEVKEPRDNSTVSSSSKIHQNHDNDNKLQLKNCARCIPES